jgi:hypothetical protein
MGGYNHPLQPLISGSFFFGVLVFVSDGLIISQKKVILFFNFFCGHLPVSEKWPEKKRKRNYFWRIIYYFVSSNLIV